MHIQKHCSDELLLAHLDGELAPEQELATDTHLKGCWECRTRAAQLEQQIQTVTMALASQSFPGPEQIAKGRQRFLELQQRYESESPLQNNTPPIWQRLRMVAYATPVMLAVLFVLMPSRPAGKGPLPAIAPKPGEVLARVRAPERAWEHTPVHQVFRAEVREILPKPQVRSARFEVWTEPQGGRFAARWQRDGRLRHGVWRSSDGRAYLYRTKLAEIAPSGDRVLDLADISNDGLDLDQIEAQFMDWVRSRQWKPIAFARDMAVFADRGGVILEAFREGPVMRLSASKQDKRMRVEIVIEVDADSYEPRLESVRFESKGRAVELRLARERSEAMSPAEITPALFLPEPSLGSTEVAVVAPKIVPLVPAPEAAVAVAPVENLAVAEIEASYALHRAGACLGEPLELFREGGRVHVRGVVGTAQRRDELLSALGQLRDQLEIDIRTEAEAVSALAPASAAPERRTEVRSMDPPLQRLLNEHYHGDQARIAQLTSKVIASSDRSLTHAWALRRLQAIDADISSLRQQTRWLHEVMVRDHEAAVRESTAETISLIEPLLATRAGRSSSARNAGLFLAVSYSNRLVHGLFAGAVLEADSIDQAVQDLWDALQEITNQ